MTTLCRPVFWLTTCCTLAACSTEDGSVATNANGTPAAMADAQAQADSLSPDGTASDAEETESSADGGATDDAMSSSDASVDAAPWPCRTRITYGSTWIHGPNHPDNVDVADGVVTWDGTCAIDGAGNSNATLSNGWQPYFLGRSCALSLDYDVGCDPAPAACTTRVSYGPAWQPAPNHPSSFDDVAGVVSWDGVCHSGTSSWAQLSNGWSPGFNGANCELSFRYVQCGGLYDNPVVPTDCPDPGVLRVGDEYFMVCTSGHYGYPIRSSTDLVSWENRGTVFTDASHPAWATGNFWAPEIHAVNSEFVVYFSATNGATGTFAIGAARASSVLGPYQDIGHPLVSEPAPGAIDAHYFLASTGKHYVLWKVDGNAVGASTPIKIQELAGDGLSLVGSPATILSNTLSWEGALVEGPWMIETGGYYYLFYSANGYNTASYGVGVARASSPLGPFEKQASPILKSRGDWGGPGHGSVLLGPHGDWVHVFHSWRADAIGQSPGRLVLVDRIQWANGWPLMRVAPSSWSQPLP